MDRDDSSDRRRRTHGSKYSCKPTYNIDRAMLSKLRGRAQDTIQSPVPPKSMEDYHLLGVWAYGIYSGLHM